MEATEAYALFQDIVAGKIVRPLPEPIVHLAPLSQLSRDIADIMPIEYLIMLSENIRGGKFLELTPAVGAMLHTCANLARQRGQKDIAIQLFSIILLHSPTDQNVRVSLFDYYRNDGNHQLACDTLQPAIDDLFQNVTVYGKNIKHYIVSEFINGNYTESLKVITRLYTTISDFEIKKISDRIEIIKNVCPSIINNILTTEQTHFSNAIKSLSEHEMLDSLSIIKEKIDSSAKSSTRTDYFLIILATCTANNWLRAFRKATELLKMCAPSKGDLKKHAEMARISPKLAAAIDDYLKVTQHNTSNPKLDASLSLQSMKAYWDELFANAQFAKLNSVIPPAKHSQTSPVSKLSAKAEALSWLEQGPEQDCAAIWYFITWQSNNEQLFRLIHGLINQGNQYVVSIGGDNLPSDIADTSALLLVDGAHLFYRPVVTWGGQKLLYINLFEVLHAFDKNASAKDWFQNICNRSYPLVSGKEAGKKLNNGHLINHPSHMAVPSWHQEWSPEVVEHLPDIFNAAIDDVFGDANSTRLRALAYDEMRYMSSVFNFSADYQILEPNFKSSKHNYNVSPYDIDIRWMSFARLIEFVDVSTETSDTFTRRLSPMIMQWVHKVLEKHDLRIGDPFVTFNKKYTDVILHNPEAIELFAAMNLGFGPEMNYFDTVRASPQYDLMDDMAHLYYRNEEYVATAQYIAEAEQSVENSGNMLIRKTVPEGAEFIKYFAEKNALEMGDGTYYYATSESRVDPDPHLFPTLELIFPYLIGKPVVIRDLNNEIKYRAVLTHDGFIMDGERRLGNWRLTDGSLVIYYEVDHYGEKIYTGLSANAHSLISAPAELVSYRNRWSLFLEWQLQDLPGLALDETIWTFTDSVRDQTFEWHMATHKDVAMMSVFEKNAYEENPSAAEKRNGKVLAIKRLNEETVYLIEADGCPVLLKLDRISRSWDRIAKTFALADSDLVSLWDTASDYQPAVSLKTTDIVGKIVIKVLDGTEHYTIAAGGTIHDNEDRACGYCSIINGALWLFGLKHLRLAIATQISYENGDWILCGWGWKNFKDRTTFRMIFNK